MRSPHFMTPPIASQRLRAAVIGVSPRSPGSKRWTPWISSAGIAQASPPRARTGPTTSRLAYAGEEFGLIAAADVALYEAKRNGRNRARGAPAIAPLG